MAKKAGRDARVRLGNVGAHAPRVLPFSYVSDAGSAAAKKAGRAAKFPTNKPQVTPM